MLNDNFGRFYGYGHPYDVNRIYIYTNNAKCGVSVMRIEMNIEELKNQAKYLRYLADGGDPHNYARGLCHSFRKEFGIVIEDLSIPNYIEIIQEFEYYSGEIMFPIKGETDYPAIEFHENLDKWTGEYGRRRRLFCAFLAEAIEKHIKSEEE